MSNSSGVLRVGVIGVRRGNILLDVLTKTRQATIVGVCDLDPERAAQVAARYGIEKTFTDIESLLDYGLDALIVATPPHLHADQVCVALAAGCHVLSEMPAVVSVDEARRLVQAVRSSGRTYMLAENRNFDPMIDSWRRMVRSDRIGEIVYAEAEYINAWFPSLGRRSMGGWRSSFPPIKYISHSLGPILSLMGERCHTASGFGTGARITPERSADDLQLGVFTTTSGTVIKILVGFSSARKPSFHFYSVYGTKGTLETSRESDQTRAFFTDVPHLEDMVDLALSKRHPGSPSEEFSAEYMMVDAFLKTIRGEIANPLDVYTALDCTLPGIIAHESALQGGIPLEVPDPREF